MLCLSGFELYSRWVPLLNVKVQSPHCNDRTGLQWYNEEIHQAKRLRRKAKRTWKSLLGCGTKNVEQLAR